MNVAYINPFVEAAEHLFLQTCQQEVTRAGSPTPNWHHFSSEHELVAAIHLSGATSGTILMIMDLVLARKVVKAFLHEITVTDEDLMDAFGEILNMLCGQATQHLPKVKVSTPELFWGRSLKLYQNRHTPWIIIPFQFGLWGTFSLEVSFDD